jgi:hypothetical protein
MQRIYNNNNNNNNNITDIKDKDWIIIVVLTQTFSSELIFITISRKKILLIAEVYGTGKNFPWDREQGHREWKQQ